MLGHAWAAMTLNVYAGLFADDFDGVADQLDRTYTKFECDQRTTRLPSQSNQGVLPFKNSPDPQGRPAIQPAEGDLLDM
jgi:hypothetical protein